ncbi:MAG: hypothetical protein IKN59_06880 [Paludibacteraceae bacterium]|nr:hypothetical protein [Paludibacteraceae bacterium]
MHTRTLFSAHGMAVLLTAMLLLIGGCQRRERVVVEDADSFRNGDMVLRCGWGAESRAVVHQSGACYSHIGLLLFDSLAGEWTVLHAVPGESPQGEPDYLKREPLSVFFAPDRARCGAWLRIDCTDSVASLAADYCRHKVEQQVLFDNDYLLADTAELYCCELVWLAYLRHGIDISDGNRIDVPTAICKEGECIFPCHIEHSKSTLFVKPFNTKRS